MRIEPHNFPRLARSIKQAVVAARGHLRFMAKAASGKH
jgi:hypothetical protein